MTVYAFDVDGTLETSAGPIPIAVLEGLKCDHYVYLVSPSSARPKGFPIVAKDSRVENLRKVKAMHPDLEDHEFLYISDNGDQAEASLAGFRYVWHNEFKVQPQMFWGTNSSSTSTTTAGFWGGPVTFRVVINAPALAPPKSPDQVWIEKVTGVVHPGPIHPRECARVRKAFETLEFSPEHRWDPNLARKRYRAMARRLHPDVGGDSDAFKALSDAWDILKRRGFAA